MDKRTRNNNILADALFAIGNAFNFTKFMRFPNTKSSYRPYSNDKYKPYEKDDLKALQSDWEQVGKDFESILPKK